MFRNSVSLRALGLASMLLGCGAADYESADENGESASELVQPLSSARDARQPPRGWSREEWETIGALSPLGPVPPDTTNAVADDRAARWLGKRLFFDPGFSGSLLVSSDLGSMGDTGKVSCASCHSGPYFDDRRSVPGNVSIGTGFHTRNAPPLANSAFNPWTNWGGRFSAQWELPLAVVESPVIMNGNRLALAHRIFDLYRSDYERVFGAMDPELGANPSRFPLAGKPKPAPSTTEPNPPDGAWEGMTADDREIINRILVNFSKALSAYTRTLTSQHSPFDRFVKHDSRALSASAQRGAKLFIGKAKCVSCHSGPNFSDGRFHNLGVPQVGEHVPATDDGRFKDVPPLLASAFNAAGRFSDDPLEGARRLEGLTNPMPELARGAFRTPSLRGVAQTGPYMHSGQLATLEDVVEFYDDGGGIAVSGTRDPRLVPLDLSDREQADLVAFLRALSGRPLVTWQDVRD